MSMSVSGLVAADLRDLVMVSYEIDPLQLVPFVPAHTSLDFFGGRTIVTLVGLRFLAARIGGVPIPFHRAFEQVNLRFYVWRQAGIEIRRGVVFLKEIVPSAMVTFGARLLFSERYVTAPMRHEVGAGDRGWIRYEWELADRWNRLVARRDGAVGPVRPGSIEAFVTDRLWGYSRRRDGSTLEYRVEHPAWEVGPVADARLDCDVAGVYGPQFAEALSAPPLAACLAAGSATVLHPGHPVD